MSTITSSNHINDLLFQISTNGKYKTCECGKILTKITKNHLQSKYHLNYFKQKRIEKDRQLWYDFKKQFEETCA
jgi:hypothetical protein